MFIFYPLLTSVFACFNVLAVLVKRACECEKNILFPSDVGFTWLLAQKHSKKDTNLIFYCFISSAQKNTILRGNIVLTVFLFPGTISLLILPHLLQAHRFAV